MSSLAVRESRAWGKAMGRWLVVILALVLWGALAHGQERPDRHRASVGGRPALVWASNTPSAPPNGPPYAAKDAFDGDPGTAWRAGEGRGDFLTVEFDQPVELQGFILLAGLQDSDASLRRYGVPTAVRIEIDGRTIGDYPLYYDRERLWEAGEPGRCAAAASLMNRSPRIVRFERPILARRVVLVVTSRLSGRLSPTPFIAEWSLVTPWGGTRLAGTDYRRAFDSLGSADGGALSPSDSVAVDNLHLAAETAARDGRSFPQDFLVRLAAVGELARPTTASEFFKVFRWEFVEAAVVAVPTTDGSRLVGSRAFLKGGASWVELYPLMVLDRDGRLTGLRVLVRRDQTPECQGLPPTTVPW